MAETEKISSLVDVLRSGAGLDRRYGSLAIVHVPFIDLGDLGSMTAVRIEATINLHQLYSKGTEVEWTRRNLYGEETVRRVVKPNMRHTGLYVAEYVQGQAPVTYVIGEADPTEGEGLEPFNSAKGARRIIASFEQQHLVLGELSTIALEVNK